MLASFVLAYWIVLNALFGLVIGSFLNVLVIRGNTGRSLAGRSGCMSCGAQLTVYELVPIFSWLFARGRCRHCGSAISVQYPLVELATAALFALVASAGLPMPVHLLTLAVFALYVAIVAYDVRHTIIPDTWSYAAAGLAFLFALVSARHVTFWTLLAGPIVAAPLYLLWLLSRGRALGLGDAKLTLSFGYLLGIVPGFVSLMYGFFLGAIFAILVFLPWERYVRLYTVLRGKRLKQRGATFTMKSEVPFGPFLIAGALIVWTLHAHQLPLPLFPYV